MKIKYAVSEEPLSLPDGASRVYIFCPLCDNPWGDITVKSGGGFWVACPACDTRMSRSTWARKVAAEVGTYPAELLKDPWRYLQDYAVKHGKRHKQRPAEPPTLASVAGWHQALLSNAAALRYLRSSRRISMRAILDHKLGYGQAPGAFHDWPAFTLPVFAAPEEPINLRKRFWPDLPLGEDGEPVKYVGLRGRGSHLYPDLPSRWQARLTLDALLVAGELDALVARRHRLPAVSTTCGAQLPRALVKPLARDAQRVAVMFDVGEEQAAERAVAVLRAAGACAWAVDLPLKRKGADLSDWFAAGRGQAELMEFIYMAKPTSRR